MANLVRLFLHAALLKEDGLVVVALGEKWVCVEYSLKIQARVVEHAEGLKDRCSVHEVLCHDLGGNGWHLSACQLDRKPKERECLVILRLLGIYLAQLKGNLME